MAFLECFAAKQRDVLQQQPFVLPEQGAFGVVFFVCCQAAGILSSTFVVPGTGEIFSTFVVPSTGDFFCCQAAGNFFLLCCQAAGNLLYFLTAILATFLLHLFCSSK